MKILFKTYFTVITWLFITLGKTFVNKEKLPFLSTIYTQFFTYKMAVCNFKTKSTIQKSDSEQK